MGLTRRLQDTMGRGLPVADTLERGRSQLVHSQGEVLTQAPRGS